MGIRDLVASPEEVEIRPGRRWRILGVAFALLFGGLAYRLYVLQVLEHQTSVNSAQSLAYRVSTLPGARGYILDRTGRALVSNVSTVQIQMSQVEMYLHPDAIGSLALLTHQRPSAVIAEVKNPQYNVFQPAPVVTHAPVAWVDFIKLHPSEFPGVVVEPVSQRSFPLGGTTGSQVLGYVGPITGQEMAQNPNGGYQTNSVIGKTGVEQYYEQFLRGHDGASVVEVKSTGSVAGNVKTVPARTGDTLVLNIDGGLQRALDGYLAADIYRVRHTVDSISGVLPKAPTGAAIVLQANTGAVLAMSSFPSYNLNSFTNGLSEATFRQLNAVGAFANYPIEGEYTPGSTFKMISATAQLQTGILSPYAAVNDTGVFHVPNCTVGCSFRDDLGIASGVINLPAAITVSSDYYFYNLGYLFWQHQAQYGTTPIQKVAAEYGLGQYSNIDLPNESLGRVDSLATRKMLHAAAPAAFPNAATWYTGDNIEMAFGQGATAVTPIEMAEAYLTFANGGTRYAPEVAAAVLTPGGKTVVRYQPKVLGHVALPPSVRNPILQGLIGVVNNPSGTAYYPFHHYANFNLNSFVVAGKTGTASNAYGQEPNSWFVSFAPASNPQYVVLCVVAQGGYGADAAAPVVAETYNYLVKHPILPPTLVASPVTSAPTSKATKTKKHA